MAAPTIERKPFGRTGQVSSRVIFGAVALSGASERESAELLDLVLERGINHIDTAPTYGDSEDQLKPWLADHREHFFVATKTVDRSGAAARASLERSLVRMGIDRVDLMQLHNLVHPGDWEVAFGPEGALEALVDARDEGLIRFLGVTGHGVLAPWMHVQSLERFPFDSVLAPYNFALLTEGRYAKDFDDLARICDLRQVALQTIKAVTRGPWGATVPDRQSWYEPLVDQADVDLAVHWVLGRAEVFLNSVGDRGLVASVLDAAVRFKRRPLDAEMAALVERRQITPLFT